MTRPKKQHRPGGIHYVVLFGNGGQEIFQDDADRQNFMDLLGVAQARCNAEILGFCLGRRDARLVVRVSDVPVGRLVQRVATQYSRNNHAKYGTAGYLFQHPYRAYLLEGTTHLLDIVRHIHLAPLEMAMTEDLDAYRWCSHHVYLGAEKLDWLRQTTVRELLAVRAESLAGSPLACADATTQSLQEAVAPAAATRVVRVRPLAVTGIASAPDPGDSVAGGRVANHAALADIVAPDVATAYGAAGNELVDDLAQQRYREFMSARGGTTEAGDDGPPPSRLPSDDQFFSWLRRHAGKPPATVTVDQVIQAVAKKMGVDRKRLLSTSRERRLTLTRALIGWHVTKNQIATLTEVSRQLGRDPSSVYTAYARYRAWRPQLFRDSLATILQYLDNDDSQRDASTLKKH
jgi:hypothetical protein